MLDSERSSKRVGRRLRRAMLAVFFLALVYFFSCYGMYTVAPGMDTMPAYPPGTFCVIEKNPRNLEAGHSVIILRAGAGGSLLSRVSRIEGDQIFIRHDNRRSVFLDHEKHSWAVDDIRGLVLACFAAEPSPLLPAGSRPPENDGK